MAPGRYEPCGIKSGDDEQGLKRLTVGVATPGADRAQPLGRSCRWAPGPLRRARRSGAWKRTAQPWPVSGPSSAGSGRSAATSPAGGSTARTADNSETTPDLRPPLPAGSRRPLSRHPDQPVGPDQLAPWPARRAAPASTTRVLARTRPQAHRRSAALSQPSWLCPPLASASRTPVVCVLARPRTRVD